MTCIGYRLGDPNTAAPADLSAPTEPAAQSLASSATTASATWTHSGAPAGTTYAVSVVGTDESTPTETGSGLGEWTWPVESGVSYAATITATGTDGQTSKSTALVQVAAAASVVGGWARVGGLTFIGATPQTFTTTGSKTVTLADASTVTVNVAMSVGSVTGGTAGADATRGLIADVPGALTSTAYQLRVAVPVSPSVATTDDLLAVVRWRTTMAAYTSGTGQRALVGLTTSTGSEASAQFSGFVLQNISTNARKAQSRIGSVAADMSATTPSGWTDGTLLLNSAVRVVGVMRTILASAADRDVDSGAPDYLADAGTASSGPNAALEPVLFSGATIYVHFYSWNGGSLGGACSAAIEQIDIYRRASVRVP